MLSAAKVRPLEEFFEPVRPRKKRLKPKKEVALSLNEGSVICLCNSPIGEPPTVLKSFRVCDLKLIKSATNQSVRWAFVDENGCWFEGGSQTVDLYKGLLLATPTSPLKYSTSADGIRAVFKFKLPWPYRLHYLGYLRRFFPHALPGPHSVN